MTFGGNQNDPFGADPFGGPGGYQPPPVTRSAYGAPGAFGAPSGPGYPPPGMPAPQGEVNSLATLSVVFAFVFAPVGAVLGHVALTQVKRTGQRGRDRALIGITLSYLVIVLAILALILWTVFGGESDSADSTAPTSTPTPTSTTTPAPRTTVVTPAPQQRPTVRVEDLRVGDCVEVVQEQPKPGQPGTDLIFIYRTGCQARDGVLRVDLIAGYRGACQGYSLFNDKETVFACVSDFRG